MAIAARNRVTKRLRCIIVIGIVKRDTGKSIVSLFESRVVVKLFDEELEARLVVLYRNLLIIKVALAPKRE